MFDRQSNNRGGQSNGNNSDWKADAFINIYLPRKDGSRMKLGFIALKNDHQEQQKIIDLLRKDPEALERLLAKLQLEFKDLTEVSAELDI